MYADRETLEARHILSRTSREDCVGAASEVARAILARKYVVIISAKLEVRSQTVMLSTCARVRSDFRRSYRYRTVFPRHYRGVTMFFRPFVALCGVCESSFVVAESLAQAETRTLYFRAEGSASSRECQWSLLM